ncbi:hypothetical protein OIU74_009117 [Salix koriyanagi]|uniref:Uncharacterized protein n=1 Tax=Salix koriyanagi TaxID=2511006 RepID=A0A9Q0Z093_9ROSI|nr:hypothetical protein OIU74_009117 [Salix koriyanagi]
MYPGLCTEDYNERPRVHADIAARTLKKWEFLLLHEIAASLRDGSGGKVVDSQREAIVNHRPLSVYWDDKSLELAFSKQKENVNSLPD